MPFQNIVLYCLIYGTDNGHLWYLMTLFLCFVFSWLLTKCIKTINFLNERWRKVVLFIVSLFMFAVNKIADLPFFSSLFKYFVFFALGEIIQLDYECFRGGGENKIIPKIVLGFICTASMVYYTFFHGNGKLLQFVELISSVSWVAFLFFIISDKYMSFFSYVSSVSYGVYLFHSPLVYITYTYTPNIHPLLMVLINFIGFGTISVLLTKMLKNSKLRILLGE